MSRVGVIGASGRMGREVCRAVTDDGDLDLVAVVDPRFEDEEVSAPAGTGAGAARVCERIEELEDLEIDVVVDFTSADVAAHTMRWCAGNAVHAVVGTTGMSQEVIAEMESLFSTSKANCVVAANFAIGAVLMMRFAELAAPHMQGAEIIELHHDAKLDAPSGTAIASANRMAEARRARGLEPWQSDRTTSEPLPGARGAQGPGGVRIHSVRLRGLVAHQEVVLGSVGQSLSIRHDAYDRASFMPGVLLAVRSVPLLDGLTVGLDALLGLVQAPS